MASQLRRVSIFEDGSLKTESVAPSSVPPLWRVLHDVELPGYIKKELFEVNSYGVRRCAPCPEVYRLYPHQSQAIGRELQWLWRNINPQIRVNNLCATFGNGIAFTNGSGWPGHANYLLMEELDRPDPYFDFCRICGGAVVTGVVDGTDLVLETIKPTQSIPSVDYVLARPWLYFDALIVAERGGLFRFPQGDGIAVRIPLVSKGEARLPLDMLQKWTETELPNPYQRYV